MSAPTVINMRRCRRCDGLGEIVIHGAKVVSWACPDCNGSGDVPVGRVYVGEDAWCDCGKDLEDVCHEDPRAPCHATVRGSDRRLQDIGYQTRLGIRTAQNWPIRTPASSDRRQS